MVELVLLDPEVHREGFRQLCLETFNWHKEELWDNYQIDTDSFLGKTITELVDDQLESYLSLKPPEGIVYLLDVDGDLGGMIALTKMTDDTGELHRMWNRPKYRGRGYGRLLLNKILEAGEGLGCSKFILSTPKFAHSAQHLYRSVGFTEREIYSESPIDPDLQSYWIYMEKKE
jgi:ribosomal protein S18 acetylase RimI-like enzyme